MDTFDPQANNFRFYDDDGSESGSTKLADENANIVLDIGVSDVQCHLRQLVQETGNVSGETTDDYTLQFQVDGSGGWTTVTAASSFVQCDTASMLSDGSDTTDRGTDGLTGGTGTFVAGEQDDQDGINSDRQLTALNYTHHVWALDLISADWGSTDFVNFRMRINGGAMDAQNQTPRITKALFIPDADKFRFYEDGTESGSSAIEAEDTDITSRDVDSDSQFHLRWRVVETGGADGAATDDYFPLVSKNGGTFQRISGSTTHGVKVDLSSDLTDGNDTTNRSTEGISNPSTGSFVAGEQDDINGFIDDRQLTALNYTEHVFAFDLISADLANGDTLDFDLRSPGEAAGDIISSITPRITVIKGPIIDADKFRLYEDGTEDGSTAIAAEDTNISRDVTSDSELHIRWRLQETRGVSGETTDDFTLQSSYNSGTFIEITTTTSQVEMDAASDLLDGVATTDRTTEGITNGSGSFLAGEQREGPDGNINDYQLTANNYTEHVWALKLIAADLSDTDTLDFHIVFNSDDTDVLSSIIPRITITKGAPSTTIQDLIMGPGIIPFLR